MKCNTFKLYEICRQVPVNFDGNIPDEVTIEDKSLMEQVKLIAELEPEEKNMVFKMIDTFLTKQKFKDFFQKNVAAL
jgi:hypothetical protein